MTLKEPTLLDKERLMDYIEEHYGNGEKYIHASNCLTDMDYDDWINKLTNDKSLGDKDWGISETYLAIDDGKLIGLLNVRYTLSSELAEIYGNIGYGVRPSERRKGYATEILKQAILLSRDKGLTEVILGCYKDNIGSIKTIEANKGVLYKEAPMQDKPAVYYKIKC